MISLKRHQKLPLASFIFSLILMILSMIGNIPFNNLDKTTHRVEDRIEKRLEILDAHIRYALDSGSDEKVLTMDIPEDMIIYRYVNDSLQSWCNQFPVLNDDISSRHLFQRLTDTRSRLDSPLSEVRNELSYESIGPKWFLVKKVLGKNNETIIAGLLVKNTLIDDLRKTENGVNRHLRLPGRFSIQPLTHSGGSPVEIDGAALFKIIQTPSQAAARFDNTILRWFALALFALTTILFLISHRTFKVFSVVISTLSIIFAIAMIWGLQMNGSSEFMSPSLYADGPILFSLGSLIIMNTYITSLFICSYIIKGRIHEWVRRDRSDKNLRAWIYILVTLLFSLMMMAYLHFSLKSLIFNSSLSLELYKPNDNLAYTLIAYLSYTGLFLCILLQMQALRPVIMRIFGIRYNLFRFKSIVVAAMMCSLYLTVISSTLGFRKEQDIVKVLANKLAVDREMELEIMLKNIENDIAGDQQIASLLTQKNSASLISNRISEFYLTRIKQSYKISTSIYYNHDINGIRTFTNILRNGEPISSNSRFLLLNDGNGHPYYAGMFLKYIPERGLIRMMVTIEPLANMEDRGYYSILGKFSKSSRMEIPPFYSYAKYYDGRLSSYNGNYPYPTTSANIMTGSLQDDGTGISRIKKHVHFIHIIGEDEMIVISRPQRGGLVYFTAFSYLSIALTLILYLIIYSRRNPHTPLKSTYFRKRINSILFVSSFLILVSITVVSIVFVYKRNEANMTNLMSQKINTIQALTETRLSNVKNWRFLATQDFHTALENISNTTKSDITLYSPNGHMFYSTTPEVFEKRILGSRINQEAYHNIVYLHQRYYIHTEEIDGYKYWALYAPLFNKHGELTAIICSPYTDKNYDFVRETFFHAALIINLFIILLFASLIFCTKEVNDMFLPLVEMGKKMNTTDTANLEYIIYKREDEISSLVDAYNRMVRNLSDSTRQLAQAERDKAWSQMARQVAHEIKNPLTPIKLEIQRLIRLKQKNNPAWEEKFDKVADVILEHIDILTDTANEFSTFAKLYSEEPVTLDLDKTLKDQLMIFDNKEDIRISYIGMDNAFVKAPRPQLIRVFVNLITNAIQAIEIQRKEDIDNGGESTRGEVLICLRNSTKDGFYDIVFDDNGPGVKEENLSKLFTPNFTTKNGGTGLGLAICRNIVEKCEGEIRYQKSFALGGASFCVSIPKLKV
ncbi:MAG: cache domain-containing protein [Bacteroidales bacterium]|nr:cache domain-containing protein [Bacteroidales bacterium]